MLVQVPATRLRPGSVLCGVSYAGPVRPVRRTAELRSSHAVAACRWCGKPAADYACHRCGARRLRASIVGAGRTAEEWAGPSRVPVRTSGRDSVLSRVEGEPALVVATPGAEPIADGRYGAVLLLDTWALLTRADLRAGEEALRRWMAAATLARPASRSRGRVVVVADGALVAVQALLRWDPVTFAARELADRRELRFPPAARMASLTGPADAVAELLTLAELPDDADTLGPVPIGDEDGCWCEVASRSSGAALASSLHAAAGVRSAQGRGVGSGSGRSTRALVASPSWRGWIWPKRSVSCCPARAGWTRTRSMRRFANTDRWPRFRNGSMSRPATRRSMSCYAIRGC
mgnify:CR=1 FL=1